MSNNIQVGFRLVCTINLRGVTTEVILNTGNISQDMKYCIEGLRARGATGEELRDVIQSFERAFDRISTAYQKVLFFDCGTLL